MSTAPAIQATLVNFGNPPLATVASETFSILADQGVSGGAGTAAYMSHIAAFRALVQYISTNNAKAFRITQSSDGTQMDVTATDGQSKFSITSVFATEAAPLVPNTQVSGIATITMQGPAPDYLERTVEAGWEILDTAHEGYTAWELWQALLKPLGSQAKTLIANIAESWMNSSAESAGDVCSEIEMQTMNAVEAISSETLEVTVVEDGVETIVEAGIEWSAVAGTFGLAAVFIIVPDIVSALAKSFIVNVQVINTSGYAWTWSLEASGGGATVQPATNALPSPAVVTNPATSAKTKVVQQGDFVLTNADGYCGLSVCFVFQSTQRKVPTAAAIVNIPWTGSNSVDAVNALDASGRPIPAGTLMLQNPGDPSSGQICSAFENNEMALEIGIDLLEGGNDTYNCVIRLRNL